MPAIASDSTVNGTASTSAVFTTAGRDSCADETSSRIFWYCEFCASWVARIVNVVDPLTAPDMTRAPAYTSRGTGSPLMLLRSSVAEPDSSSPSTGTVSPGRTRITSPSSTRSTGTVSKCSPDASYARAAGLDSPDSEESDFADACEDAAAAEAARSTTRNPSAERVRVASPICVSCASPPSASVPSATIRA